MRLHYYNFYPRIVKSIRDMIDYLARAAVELHAARRLGKLLRNNIVVIIIRYRRQQNVPWRFLHHSHIHQRIERILIVNQTVHASCLQQLEKSQCPHTFLKVPPINRTLLMRSRKREAPPQQS